MMTIYLFTISFLFNIKLNKDIKIGFIREKNLDNR